MSGENARVGQVRYLRRLLSTFYRYKIVGTRTYTNLSERRANTNRTNREARHFLEH